MFFLTSICAGVESVEYCDSSLDAVINFLKKCSLDHHGFRIYTSCDFLNVRFLDNKILID